MKAGWQVKRLGEVCEIVNGGTPKSEVAEYWDGGVQWLTPKDMGRLDGFFVHDTPRKISALGLSKCSARMVPSLSVIMSTRAPIGHLAINTVPMSFNQGCRAMVPGTSLDAKFLFYFLSANVENLKDLGTGTTFKELSAGALKAFSIPLPPLEEQKRIVAILDEAFEGLTRARAHTETNLQNARDLFEQTVANSFLQIQKSSDVKTERVAELANGQKGSIRTGPFGSQLLRNEFAEDGIAVLGIDNAVNNEFRWGKRRFISNEKYQELKRYTVYPGDVIITIMGTCGRCAIVPDDIPTAINTKHLCCISLDRKKCLPEYLHAYFLHSPKALSYLTSHASGSVMDGLNMGLIKDLPVDLPDIASQQKIADVFAEAKANLATLQSVYRSKLADLDALRQSLLQKAFAGELT